MLSQLWHDVRYRVRALLFRKALDEDLQEEVDSHVAREADRLIHQGTPAPEAWRHARIAFGGIEGIKTATRDARGTAWLESCLHDVRAAFRALRARPSATIGAATTLALGIGTLTVTFTATKAMRLDPLPYPESERLVMIWATSVVAPERRLAPTVPEYVAWRDRTNLFEAVGTLSVIDGDLGSGPGDAPSETVVVQQCTPSLLQALQVHPMVGRLFSDAESRAETPRVALIGHDLWQRRFAGTPDTIGRTLVLDGVEMTIVGIMPDDVSPQHSRVDVWTPIRLTPARLQGSGRGWPVIARLRPGVRLAEAQIETDVISARLAHATGAPATFATRVEPLRTALFGSYARLFVLVEAMAVAVFFASCASVTGLFLMYVSSRRRALAVRAAVGASRGRLVRQVATEGALVSAAAGVVAGAIVWAGLGFVLSVDSWPSPPLVHPVVDLGALSFLTVATVVGFLLLSLLPVLYVSRVRPADVTASASRHATASPRSRLVRHTLVVGQVALATILLVGAGLLATTLHRIDGNPLGGDPRGVITFQVRYPPTQYRTERGAHDGLPLMEVSALPGLESEQIRRRLEQLSAVTSAAVVSQVPFSGLGSAVSLVVDGASSRQPVAVEMVSPRFFDTLQIPLLAGRDFTPADTEVSPWGVVVNQALATALGSDRPPLGRTLRLALGPDERPRTVIGIVENVKPSPLASGPVPTAYLPFSQLPSTAVAPRLGERLLLTFVARTTGDARAISPEVTRVVAEVAPERVPSTVRPLDATVGRQIATRQHLLLLFGFFAVTVTTLALVGIRGAISHHMAERARDLGVRIAFGAGVTSVWRLTIGRLMRLLVPGVTIGLLAAWSLSPAIANALWGVPPGYLPAYVGAGIVIVVAAVVVTALLVRRVLATSPAAVLSVE